MTTKLDKKSLQYLGIVAIIAILVCVGSFYFLSQVPEIEEPEEKEPAELKKGEIIKQQLKGLEEEAGSLSEKEIKKQLEELEKLR